MNDYSDFCKVLFNPDENICVGSSVYEKAVRPVQYYGLSSSPNYVFISINPLKDFRADKNVTAFRNILIEFDDIPLDKQMAIIETIPYSSIVFSGNKSYHTIISLSQDLPNKEAYDALVKRIYTKLPLADQSTKNASRLTRTPCGWETGRDFQKLIKLGERVPLERILAWLGPEEVIVKPKIVASSNMHRILNPFTKSFLRYGAPEGKWNDELYRAVWDMLRSGYTEEECVAMTEQITGSLDKKDRNTIQSAIKAHRAN